MAGDHIQKTITGIPLNHYQIMIRLSVGHIGAWNPTDEMQMTADGYTYAWNYTGCSSPVFLCNQDSAAVDCIKIYEQTISHDRADLTLKFSNSLVVANPNKKYWGLKDYVVVAKMCHIKCSTCFGPTEAECISCEAGYFLIGNLCVKNCLYFAVT